MHPEPADPQRDIAGEDDELPASARERIVGIASVTSATGTATLLVWHGAWGELGWWMTAPFVVVWCCVPYAWVGSIMRLGRHHEASGRLGTAGAALIIGIGVWVLWNYHTADVAHGGRVFLMLPIWQGLAFAPLALLARWLRPVREQPD